MTESSSTSSGGVGFGSLLILLFVGLKLTGYIDWSWWWVLAPAWIPVIVFVAVLALLGTGTWWLARKAR